MILAGIDEAGYGPMLGPLVVGCCAFEVPGPAPQGDLPCLWKQLGRVISKNRGKTGRKLHINDSKLVYNPSLGIKELERSVLAVAGALWGNVPEDLSVFLGQAAAECTSDLREHPWYDAGLDGGFPIEQDATALRIFSSALAAEMKRTGTQCTYLNARILPERQFNRRVESTRNKGSVNFSLVAIHLDYLLRNHGAKDLVIFCDRQGGRERYGGLLRTMFEDWDLEIVREEDGYAEYFLIQSANRVRLVFCEKGETKCMPVALASMLSKYAREALMRRFNAYWKKLLPNLSPTAGYYNDSLRFLQDIDAKRREMKINDSQLIRAR